MYIYIYIVIKSTYYIIHKAERVFMMTSFIFHQINNSFYDQIIYLVPEGFSIYVDIYP